MLCHCRWDEQSKFELSGDISIVTDRQLSSNCPLSLKHVKILEARHSEVPFSARIDVDNITVLYPSSVKKPMMTFWMEFDVCLFHQRTIVGKLLHYQSGRLQVFW